MTAPVQNLEQLVSVRDKLNATIADVAVLLTKTDDLTAAVEEAVDSAADATTQAGIATTQAGIATTQAGIATTQAGIATTQAGTATTQAGTATTQAGLATTARTAAETARDAAFINANVYADTTTGLAAVADGVQFQVVSGNQIIRYVRTNSTTATEVARYPSATPVNALISAERWRGRKNIVPDPFFRIFNYPDDTFGGNPTWNVAGQFTTFSKVANPFYNGFALRKTGSTELAGPRVNIADFGLVAGDTVTFAAELAGVAGQTCTLRMAARAYNAAGSAVNTQLTMVDANGLSGYSIAAGTKVTVSISFVIPANTAFIRLYPFHTNAGDVADVVSLWGVKGTASDLPAVPPLTDDPDVVNIYTGLSGEALSRASAANDYAFFERTNVSYSALSSVLGAPSYTASARALTFSGWGTRLTPAGVTFNAIRVPTISRTATTEDSKWSTLNVVIRTGTNSQNAGATVVAVGSVRVNPDADTLTNVIIPLKDPSTTAFKTLTNADFSGSEYSIMVYALNLAGAPAACGECRGTMPNFQGNSYYVTSGNPQTTTWLDYTSDPQLGYEHVLLTSPAEALVSYPRSEFISDIQTELTNTTPAPEVVTPPAIFGVQNREANIYFDNLFLDDASRYNINFDSVSSVGQHQEERWTWTPTGAVTTGNATLNVYDKRVDSLLVTKTIAQRAAASSAGSGLNKKVCVIGDSLTNNGTITQTLLDIATGDVMGVTLIGTRGSGLNKHEGRGGWTVAAYTSDYSDATGPNPFWKSGAVNFAQYLTDNSLATPDWAFIQLGTNDVFGQTSDASCSVSTDVILGNLDTLINSIKAAGAGINVGLMLPPPPAASQDAFGANYDSGQARWRFKRNILIFARQMITKYTGQEANRIYLVPSNTAVDTVNNFSRAAAAPVNSRNSSITIARQDNSVHPATSGYQQIGDALWAFLKYYA